MADAMKKSLTQILRLEFYNLKCFFRTDVFQLAIAKAILATILTMIVVVLVLVLR
jgi:hypothetical protein